MIFWLPLLLLLLVQLILYCSYWRARRNFRHLPSFPQLPFMGSMFWFLGDGRVLFRRLTEISKIMEDKNMPLVGWLGPIPFIFISDPEDVKTVTNSYLEKPFIYKFAQEWVGNGLVTAPVEIWKKNVKKIAATFTKTMVDGFQETFNEKALQLVEFLKEGANKNPFNAMPQISYTSLSAICETGLGVTENLGSNDMKKFFQATLIGVECLILRVLSLVNYPDTLYRLSSNYKKYIKSVAVMHNISNTIIKKKKRDREVKKNIQNEEKKDSHIPSLKTVLDVLLDMSEVDPNMTEEQITAEVHTIIGAGHDTVAEALNFTLLMLGCNHLIQEKLHVEVTKVFKNKTYLDVDDLADLVYCEAVILESLRMLPPVPLVIRYADRDLKIQSCTIPKGTLCGVHIYAAGRSKRFWGDDADQFIPERWLLPRAPSTASFFPFSAGKRVCIGKKYAMAIMKTFVAHCVKNLEFISEAENLEFSISITLQAVKGNLLQVKIRD